jgi:hypothetical protein
MIRILIIFLFASSVSFAQKLDSTKKLDSPKVLSTKSIVLDTTKKTTLEKNNRLKSIFNIDSAKKGNIPRKVLLRSLVLPGWGQATNKQYWIIPVVYGAAAGGIYSYWRMNDNYWYYKHKLQNIINDKQTSVIINERKGLFLKEGKEIGSFTQAQIEPAVKAYHRYRDLSVIFFALGWTLQAVQANVSAHLKGFDMSDDISVKLEPNIQSTSFGNAVGVKIGINF